METTYETHIGNTHMKKAQENTQENSIGKQIGKQTQEKHRCNKKHTGNTHMSTCFDEQLKTLNTIEENTYEKKHMKNNIGKNTQEKNIEKNIGQQHRKHAQENTQKTRI